MSYANPTLTQSAPTETRLRLAAVGAAVFAVTSAIVVYGAYGDPHPRSQQEAAVPFLLVVAAVATAGVFGWLVPKGLCAIREERARSARWALGLSIGAAVLFPVVFWSGVPLVLGSAGALLGLRTREQRARAGSPTKPGTAAVVVGMLPVVATVAVTVLTNTLT